MAVPAALPVSGGDIFLIHALVLTFGELVLLSGFGLALQRRSSS